ncbi:hypothetical protein ACIA5D_46605 [Actinoplanes sp. NPDC051513]|uniref:hypothetical protein n=1 Tax=Actinoplanes sp. NPDC051513 TaxID=3363908 RepID=UPI00378B6395
MPVDEGGIDAGVEQRAVGVEAAVGDHQRQVPVAGRQAQRGFLVVVVQVESVESAPDARAGEVHPVVVVPEGRGALIERVRVGAFTR